MIQYSLASIQSIHFNFCWGWSSSSKLLTTSVWDGGFFWTLCGIYKFMSSLSFSFCSSLSLFTSCNLNLQFCFPICHITQCSPCCLIHLTLLSFCFSVFSWLPDHSDPHCSLYSHSALNLRCGPGLCGKWGKATVKMSSTKQMNKWNFKKGYAWMLDCTGEMLYCSVFY